MLFQSNFDNKPPLFFKGGLLISTSLKGVYYLMGEQYNMRLDKYLKVSRIIKRRTIANEACDAGRVLVGGKQARASYEVKEGDKLEINFGARTVKLEVVSVNEFAKKDDAALLYKIID